MLNAILKNNNFCLKPEEEFYQRKVQVKAVTFRVSFTMMTLLLFFFITTAQSYAGDKTIDQKLNQELKSSVLSYFGHKQSGSTTNPMSIVKFEGFKFKTLWRNIYRVHGGLDTVNGRPTPRSGSHVFIKFSDPAPPLMYKMFVEAIAAGSGGIKEIVRLDVMGGVRVETKNGNRYIYKKGHWKPGYY